MVTIFKKKLVSLRDVEKCQTARTMGRFFQELFINIYINLLLSKFFCLYFLDSLTEINLVF